MSISQPPAHALPLRLQWDGGADLDWKAIHRYYAHLGIEGSDVPGDVPRGCREVRLWFATPSGRLEALNMQAHQIAGVVVRTMVKFQDNSKHKRSAIAEYRTYVQSPG